MSIIKTSLLPVLFFGSLATSIVFAQQAAPKIELLSRPCRGKTVAKVSVFFSGITQLNGKPVSLKELGDALKNNKTTTAVCYYREHPESDATPPQTEQVLNAVIQARLPIAFYWDAQFKKLVSFKE